MLEEVYETAEDIQRVLESPRNENDEDEPKNKSSTKSLRDLITYTEPLTPMLQEVLDDFASESEEDCMQIVEDIPENNEPENVANNNKDNGVDINKETVMSVNNTNDSPDPININKPFRAIDLQKVIENSVLEQINCTLENKSTVVENVGGTVDCQDIINLCSENDSEDILGNVEVTHPNANSASEKRVESSTQNCSHNTTDTVLPNNQEALDANRSTSKTVNSADIISCIDTTEQQPVESQNRMSSNSIENSENTTDKDGQLNETTEKMTEKQANKNSDCKQKEIEVDTNETFDKSIDNTDHQQNDSHECPVNSNTTEPNMESVNMKNIENPCLQSVNLYTENLETGHKSDSSIAEISTTNQDPSNKVSDVAIKSVGNKVVVLNSHSESSNTPPKYTGSKPTTKIERHKAFANLFGFTGGKFKKRISGIG